MEILGILPKDVIDIVYLYIFAYNKKMLNRQFVIKMSMVTSKIDFVYSTKGKYYEIYSDRVSFDTYEHQYRHCKKCGCWIIATRLTNPEDKIYKCWSCDPQRRMLSTVRETVNKDVVDALLKSKTD